MRTAAEASHEVRIRGKELERLIKSVGEVRRRSDAAPASRRQRAAKRSLVELVDFVHARQVASWVDRFAAWNRSHPKQRYSAVSNMQRDYARAMRLARGG